LSDKAGPDQCPVPGENALFPAQIAGFLVVSRPVPVYPVFLNYVVPVHQYPVKTARDYQDFNVNRPLLYNAPFERVQDYFVLFQNEDGVLNIH
jgi:hypothetical protein